jgi:hypothetical protein
MTETTTHEDPALFPITAAERVARVRVHLETALEKAEKRVERAREKVDAAQAELDEFDAAIEAVSAGDEG